MTTQTTLSIPHDERLVTDRDFLLALDPELEAVRPIRAAALADDLAAARAGLVAYFRTRMAPRWFFDLRNERRAPLTAAQVSGAFFEGCPPEEGARGEYIARMIQRADEVCGNVIRLTGNLPLDLGPELNWRTRELRGLTNLPSVFKRLHFLRELAVAYVVTADGRYARKFDEMMSRWLRDWPMVVDEDMNLDGVIFSMSEGHKTMPTAARWLTWMDCLYSGVVFAPEVSLETAFGLLKSLWFTALQYRRFAGTPHAPANHHLWSRGVMPVVFGAMLPEFPEVRALVEQGRPAIEWHTRHGFLPDGGYEERSLSYSLYVLRMYQLAMAMERLNGVQVVGDAARAAIRRCADVTAVLTLPNGAFPDIGDGTVDHTARTARELADLAVNTGSRVAGAVIGRLNLAKYLSAETRAMLPDVTGVELPLTLHLPDSGYFVARDGWRPDSSALALSLPGQGLPSHQHDDALSLQFIARGMPVVGTPYSELKALVHQDKYFHRQACGQLYAMTSHNLVLVGGQPLRHPRELTGIHGVTPTPVTAVCIDEASDGVTISASHTGYPGVCVSRQVRFSYGQGWTVIDEVDAPGPHIARWHFEYGVEVFREGKAIVAQRGDVRLVIRYASPGGCRARLYRDQRWLGTNPLRPGTPAPWVLDIRFGGEGDCRLETSLTL